MYLLTLSDAVEEPSHGYSVQQVPGAESKGKILIMTSLVCVRDLPLYRLVV